MDETRVVHVKDNVPGAVYIGRAMPQPGLREGSSLANPFKIGRDGDRAEVIRLYRLWLERFLISYEVISREIVKLRDKPLACWCRHDGEEQLERNVCHGDVLIEFLTRYSDDELLKMPRDYSIV